jgi:hypothetical protein
MNRHHPSSALEDLKEKTPPPRRRWFWLFMLVLLFVGVYVCDYFSVRYRILKNRDPFGVVKIQRYYAVRLKDGKTEFVFQEPEIQVCVHSLFPHFGCSPCWYVKRRNVKRIDI